MHWSRAHIDGVPFRGQAPLMKEEEYQARVEREVDGRIQAFKLWEPAEKKACEAVLDGIANNWYKLIDRDKQYVAEHASWIVLLMWVEPYNVVRSMAGEFNPIGS